MRFEALGVRLPNVDFETVAVHQVRHCRLSLPLEPRLTGDAHELLESRDDLRP
jgi:hypothetical protein